MLTFFWVSKGQVLEHYMHRGSTTNSEDYFHLLENQLKTTITLNIAVCSVLVFCCKIITHGLIEHLQQHKKFANMHLECLPHPHYLTDLAQSDYHVLGPIKAALDGKKFSTAEDIQEFMHSFVQSVRRLFFSRSPGTRVAVANLR